MPGREVDGKFVLPRGVVFALIVLALPLLALIALQSYEAATRSARLADDRNRITHTFQVIDTAEALQSSAQNLERFERGYLLSGAGAFLDAYRKQVSLAQQNLQQLRELTADSPEQVQRFPRLKMILDYWIAQGQEILDTYNRDGAPAARQLLASHAAQDTGGTLGSLVDATIVSERELLIQRQARAARDEARTAEVAVVSGALGLALLTAGVWLAVLAFRNYRAAVRERRETEHRLNEQLLQAQAALAQTQKMEALGQLTGGVAHDFNNLLHVIKNALLLVQRRLPNADPQVLQYLEMANRNTDLAAATTARLLAFARQQPLDPRPADINQLVPQMGELLRHTLGESISLETALGGDLWLVYVDRSQLEIAIVNLAVNARDAMPSGGKLAIETGNVFLDDSYVTLHGDARVGQYAMVAVSDTGVGMSQEVQQRAFDPFFTTKEHGRGTGLGLSQVFGFVKQSGGHIAIDSTQGRGTSVKMYFPRLIESTEAPESNEDVREEQPGSGESILVVEDNEDVRTFVSALLRQSGYRVSAAPDARDALRLLEQSPGIDLLFTDIGLPGMDGRELAREAKRRWPRMRVLYTTGYARNTASHQAGLDPGVEVVVKPFTEAILASRVRQALDAVAA